MIKLIILDVDGVIVGEKIGFNSPNPNAKVIERLKSIHKKGIVICLCTAKPWYSVKSIIDQAKLNNLHITDAGGLIINPLENKIFKQFTFELNLTRQIIHSLLDMSIYTEFYTLDNYFVQSNQVSKTTKLHTHILQKEPSIVEDLIQEASNHKVIKIMPIVKSETDKAQVEDLMNSYKNKISFSWGIHPIALPRQFGIITSNLVSKIIALKLIAKNFEFTTTEILGIGDSKSDWQFMEYCGFVGSVENANVELKNLCVTKGEGNYFIGKSVDENGIIDVLDFYEL